jgi:hypothetical protein
MNRRRRADARHGAPPHTLRGLRPCDPEEKPFYEKKVFESEEALPLVGSGQWKLSRCLLSPRVTFSFDPTETGPGYILK